MSASSQTMVRKHRLMPYPYTAQETPLRFRCTKTCSRGLE